VLGLERHRRTIVVFGGSQGAVGLNRAVIGAVAMLRDRDDVQLFITAGPAHHDVVADATRDSGKLLVRVVPFLDRMELALAIADAAVSRSGAGHVAELTVCGIPAILVPYPHATENHQEANARELVRAGAAELLLDRELTATVLAERVGALVDDEDRRRAMSDAARVWSKPDAAERIARLVTEVAAA
jgi:UDP-N-acetylglucosamine--N-acetylmuramyl-(pentapeptide) pyrophosphoryl-undecaprenol N-acetylglucosamine transferase